MDSRDRRGGAVIATDLTAAVVLFALTVGCWQTTFSRAISRPESLWGSSPSWKLPGDTGKSFESKTVLFPFSTGLSRPIERAKSGINGPLISFRPEFVSWGGCGGSFDSRTIVVAVGVVAGRHVSRCQQGKPIVWSSPNTYNFIFFLGPGRALGFGPSTPAPKLLFDPVFGVDSLAVFFPDESLVAGCGLSEAAAASDGEGASGLTWVVFVSRSNAGTFGATSGVCWVGDEVDDRFSGASGAKRAKALLDSLRHMILLPLGALLFRVEVGGVETLARPLEARRTGLLDFVFDGMSMRYEQTFLQLYRVHK